MTYQFHYTPTGTGVISGKEVLEQTEDAINDLGDQISGDVQTAIDTANNALNTANTASADAQNAINTANTAYTAATNAQNTANTAQNTASNALTAAQNAQNDINALGNRVTTAEGNITQNTNAITGLTTRMGTAEGNIGNLQTAVSTAQATANSAQQTATTARQQSYVFRYSSTALTASSTNANSLLDNTDNLKVGDKVIDSNGVLFSITAIDTANSTFTIGTALIDLAQDSDVVHKSGNETISGIKIFSDSPLIYNSDSSASIPQISLKNQKVVKSSTTETGAQLIYFADKNNQGLGQIEVRVESNGSTGLNITSYGLDSNNQNISTGVQILRSPTTANFAPNADNAVTCGRSLAKWSGVYSYEYYYGANNTPFTDKFVTTDTNQTISESKTFANTIKFKKEIELTGNRLAYILPEFSASYSGLSLCTYDASGAVRIGSWKVDDNDNTKHVLNDSLGYLNVTTGAVNSVNIVYLIPRNASKAKLGDSVNKWYEINGVEPSSLSLPSGNVSDVIDISSYITALDGTSNSYTVPANGWISIAVVGTAIAIVSSRWSDSRLRASSGNVKMLYPVLKNEALDISVIGTTLAYARFIPCQGNI